MNTHCLGLVPPVITPLIDDHTIDETAFRMVMDRLIAGGADALFIGGTAGLGPLLTQKTWVRMMEVAFAHVGERLPLHAGVMETSTARANERIAILERIGYKSFVLTPTFYCVPRTAGEFLAHFGACREATSLNMVAYNIPTCTGSAIPLEVILEMSQRGWIQACKDSSGDPMFFAELCKRGSETGLAVLQGNRPDMAQLQKVGAAGIVPVVANLFPTLLANSWRTRSGDELTVKSNQAKIDRLWSVLVKGADFLSGSIRGLSRVGIGNGYMLSPLQGASPDTEAQIADLIADQSYQA